jgi:hypothetical protein
MEVHMIVEDLSVEIAEAAAMVVEVAVTDGNAPYIGAFLFKQTFN